MSKPLIKSDQSSTLRNFSYAGEKVKSLSRESTLISRISPASSDSVLTLRTVQSPKIENPMNQPSNISSFTTKPRLGKRFEGETRDTFKYFANLFRGDLYWFRLYDWYDMQRKLPPRKQPADFVVIYKGQASLIECKSCMQTSFPFEKNIKQHQRDSLMSWHRAGGKAYILFQRIIETDSIEKRVFALEITQFEVLLNAIAKSGRKSMKWEEIRAAGRELPMIKGNIYNLELLWLKSL